MNQLPCLWRVSQSSGKTHHSAGPAVYQAGYAFHIDELFFILAHCLHSVGPDELGSVPSSITQHLDALIPNLGNAIRELPLQYHDKTYLVEQVFPVERLDPLGEILLLYTQDIQDIGSDLLCS
jgi:hypothetical protein